MCGISAILGSVDKVVNDLLSKRGPDSLKTIKIETTSFQLTLTASVLHMRGSSSSSTSSSSSYNLGLGSSSSKVEPCSTLEEPVNSNVTIQPLTDSKTGNIFLWNGELYLFDDKPLPNHINDTQFLFDILNTALTTNSTNTKDSSNLDSSKIDATNLDSSNLDVANTILGVMEKCQGPWSFIFYHAQSQSLLFGRDFIGRRSLLYSIDGPNQFSLCSVSTRTENNWIELAPSGIYYMALSCLAITNPRYLRKDKMGNFFDPQKNFVNWSKNPFPARTLQSLGSFSRLSDHSSSHEFLKILIESTKVRLNNLNGMKSLAILFSGGIDSALVAALCHKVLPIEIPIELINVSFVSTKNQTTDNITDRSPDRVTALQTYEELKRIGPDRDWRLILVDIKEEEVIEHQHYIWNLCKPKTSVMDLTIGIALWFGARGVGYLYPNMTTYRSTSRIIMTGHGADEQLGGYKRHKSKFLLGGFSALQEELDLDLKRLWSRNLGRDDRLISDWGRELRCPFLDERVIAYLSTISLEEICNLTDDCKNGDKQILREAGKIIGLTASTELVKKAIQFGTKSASLYQLNQRKQGFQNSNDGFCDFVFLQ